MPSTRHQLIRALFEEYVELYVSRDDLLTTRLSENFCGYTGGGHFLVDDRQVWIDITRQDFAQLPARAHIEVLDLKLQDLHDDIVVVTALTHIRLPMPVGEISREFVRLTLIFRREGEDWKAVYVAVSIPDQMVRDGEVYPITGLVAQNQALQRLLDERTLELSAANEKLKALTPTKDRVRQCLEGRRVEGSDMPGIAQALNLSTRTLVRRLQAEGTNFLEIKDQLRRDTTLRLLHETSKSVEDIALQVGFESLTAFHRAFKAWTGSTPMAYRRKAERRKSGRRAADG